MYKLLVLVPLLLTVEAVTFYYPNFFDSARYKPVNVNPEGAVCGLSSTEKYCLSQSSEESTRSCTEEECADSCPHGDSLPVYKEVLTVAGDQGACVQRDGSNRNPDAPGAYAVIFKAQEDLGDCGSMTIPNSQFLEMGLNQEWKTVFSLWIKHDMGSNEDGTILDISSTELVIRLSIEGTKLKIRSGANTITDPLWSVSKGQWTHISIMLFGTSITVYKNGVSLYPTMYNQDILAPGNTFTANFKLGSAGEGTNAVNLYRGWLQDFKIYMGGGVSNRGAKEVYDGTFEELRIQSECRCPPNFPLLKEDTDFCGQNGGVGASDQVALRLNQKAHPAGFVNDNKIDTSWISKLGTSEVDMEINLKQTLEIYNVELLFYSPYPDVILIERKQNSTAEWTMWQMFSQDCLTHTGYPVNGELTYESDVNCKLLVPANQEIPYTQGNINANLIDRRPGLNPDDNTINMDLRHFLQAQSVRITFRGHPYVSRLEHQYHGIYSIKINSTCDCHGHAKFCNVLDDTYDCSCESDTYTQGDTCDTCVDNTYRLADGSAYDPDYCKPCDCDENGVVDVNGKCAEIDGQCTCKPNVEGRQCSVCKDGFFNLDEANDSGCEPCNCNTDGTVDGSVSCDATTGQCMCKENVEGLHCDVCMEGYFNLDPALEEGCESCMCNVNGTVDMDTICDADGLCPCKEFVIGRSCNECEFGYYDLDGANPSGCSECQCNSDGSLNDTCDIVTGQCNCKTNVAGLKCDNCDTGYYALNQDDYIANGCQLTCACNVNGTDSQNADTCEGIGGECTCKSNVEGFSCDTCKDRTYGFGMSTETGCIDCNCAEKGSINDLHCNNSTGQCYCKEFVTGQRCDECINGYYNIEDSNLDGCSPCECFLLGTGGEEDCDAQSGQCSCVPGAGDVKKGGLSCQAYTDTMDPTYGPSSGGTEVTIATGYIGGTSNVTVSIGGTIPCDVSVQKSNTTQIICMTPSLSTLNKTVADLAPALNVVLTLADGSNIDVDQQFNYKPDPIINTITPLKSITKGGILLTVTGEDLTSVAYPVMEVTMVWYRNTSLTTTETFDSLCSVESATTMYCPTPELDIPDGAVQVNRRRRQAEEDLSVEFRLNNDRLQFYLGFKLDGVTTYRNMSQVAPQYGILTVYVDPEFEEFEDDLLVFQPYWPFQDDHIVIGGSKLNFGVSVSAYNVSIGTSFCEQLELSTNAITCVPPAKQPEPKEGVDMEGAPDVTVSVGQINQRVGFLKYEHTFWDNFLFRWAVVGGCAGALVLIILLVVCCLCCCCRKKGDKGGSIHRKLESLESGTGLWGSSQKRKQNPYLTDVSEASSHSNPRFTSGLMEVLPNNLRKRVNMCLIEDDQLVLGKLIAQGTFGRIFIGRLAYGGETSGPCEIKTLTEDKVSPKDNIKLLEDTTSLVELDHPNIMRVVGIVIRNNTAFTVYNYMENGDLRSFMSNEENILTVGDLIDFGLQIAKGMDYLSQRNFIHKDLACRNCMVDKDLNVRIGDSGLSSDIYSADYVILDNSPSPIPVRWMALEGLEKHVFTTKTDVWAYGIVLWEIMTRGCVPYPDVEPAELKFHLMCGNRMDRPDFSPEDIYSIMLACWHGDPFNRPSFQECTNRVEDYMERQKARTQLRNKHRERVPGSRKNTGSYLSVGGY